MRASKPVGQDLMWESPLAEERIVTVVHEYEDPIYPTAAIVTGE